jgi:hypothetical protein
MGLDFDRAQPNAPSGSERAHDHWHTVPPGCNKHDKKHLRPGHQIPDPPPPVPEPKLDMHEVPKWKPFQGPFWDNVRDWQRDVEDQTKRWLNNPCRCELH